jgi:type VI secretion system protein ImpC
MSTAEQSQSESSAATTTQEASLLDQIIAQGRLGRDEEQRALAKDLIGEFVDQVMHGTMRISQDMQAMINARVGAIDALLSRQLNAILHHPEF